jgi:hypothetical protein
MSKILGVRQQRVQFFSQIDGRYRCDSKPAARCGRLAAREFNR